MATNPERGGAMWSKTFPKCYVTIIDGLLKRKQFMRSICFVNFSVLLINLWILVSDFYFLRQVFWWWNSMFFHVGGAIVVDQFSGEVFKKLLMFKELSRIMTKPTKWHVRPVWSESSMCALWVAKDYTILHANSKDSDAQVDLSLRWPHIPFSWFCLDATHLSFTCMCLVSMCLGLSDISGSKCMFQH